MIPVPVLAECREQARLLTRDGLPINRRAEAIVVAVWVLAVAGTVWFLLRFLGLALGLEDRLLDITSLNGTISLAQHSRSWIW
jgi:hypothetical protein